MLNLFINTLLYVYLLDRINRILQDYSFLSQIPDEFKKIQSAHGGSIIHSKIDIS